MIVDLRQKPLTLGGAFVNRVKDTDSIPSAHRRARDVDEGARMIRT